MTNTDLYRVVTELRSTDGRITITAGQPIPRDTAMAWLEHEKAKKREDRDPSIISTRVVTEDEYQQTIQQEVGQVIRDLAQIFDAEAAGGAA